MRQENARKLILKGSNEVTGRFCLRRYEYDIFL